MAKRRGLRRSELASAAAGYNVLGPRGRRAAAGSTKRAAGAYNVKANKKGLGGGVGLFTARKKGKKIARKGLVAGVRGPGNS